MAGQKQLAETEFMIGTMIFICIPYIHIRLVIKRVNIGTKTPEFESWLCHCINV